MVSSLRVFLRGGVLEKNTLEGPQSSQGDGRRHSPERRYVGGQARVTSLPRGDVHTLTHAPPWVSAAHPDGTHSDMCRAGRGVETCNTRSTPSGNVLVPGLYPKEEAEGKMQSALETFKCVDGSVNDSLRRNLITSFYKGIFFLKKHKTGQDNQPSGRLCNMKT